MHIQWNENDNKKRRSTKVSDVKSKGIENKQAVNSDIFQALSPIYFISKVCGLLPVRFTKQANARYKGRVCVIDLMYSWLFLGFIMGIEGWCLWRELKDGWENSTRLNNYTAVIPTSSDILSVIILATISVLASPFRWKYCQDVINKLAEIDEILGIVAPKKTRRYSIVLTACTIPYLVMISSLDMCWWNQASKATKKMDDKGPVNFVPIYFMYMIIIILEIQYSVAVYNIGQRFLRLNQCLETMLKNGKMTAHFRKDLGLAGDFKIRDQQQATYVRQDPGHLRASKTLEWYPADFGVSETKNTTNKIAQFVTVHSFLCDTVSSINNAFGLVMVVVTLTCLLHLVITPYFLIVEINGSRQWLFVICQTLWCILHVTRMLIIIQPTYFACEQAKKTAIIVSQLLSSDISEDCRRHLEVFSLQLIHRPLDFTACGLFSLDRTLVTSIAGAVTTYLVILLQFQKEDHAKNDVDNILKNATQILKNASSLHNFTTMKLNR